MPTAIIDDNSVFPAVTTPSGGDVPNAAGMQVSVQQLANRTAFLKAHDVFVSYSATFLQLQAMIASSWFSQSTGTSLDLKGVCGAGQGFNTAFPTDATLCGALAVGVGPGPCTILFSRDYEIWAARTAVGTSTTAFGVAQGNGGVAVVIMNGASGQNVQTTSNSGVTWTLRASGITLAGQVGGIAVDTSPSAKGWVIVGGVGGAAAVSSSPDGITWTARTLGAAANQMVSVTFSIPLGLFIAAGFNTGTNAPEIWTSPDGATWTQRAVPTAGTNHAAVVVARPDIAEVLMVSATDGSVWRSTNGTAWVLWSAGAIGQTITALIHTGVQWLAVAARGDPTMLASSVDGALTFKQRRSIGVDTNTGNSHFQCRAGAIGFDGRMILVGVDQATGASRIYTSLAIPTS